MQNNIKTPGEREKLFLRLYKLSFPDVATYVRKRGGTLEDARDIFQDCLVVYYEKAVAPDAPAIRNEGAYLMGVAKKLWYRMYAEGNRFSEAAGQNSISEDIAGVSLVGSPARENIADFLEQAGKKCMDMLKAFYYDKISMKEMAGHFGFRSVRSATVQKYKCLEKVRNKIREKSLHYEDFMA
ncbi:RNA polymerase sigma factor [Sinomicrobium weinanense]|uniref:Sigma-70 family RNA polymerase sigma factor n=1 Tax=Sinomicrobium weinanense TaxID=2842200 RepID=A0A926Q384_9FLAO|nr:sigma-70 family RNA polymerase sigma factor [Sinomicrobium weinanense]MBC9797303.1 sigma-70 family RNA polymerase sigma factor [Sinomicrobium weinanense]MBU3122772.1 hypothetical protein [Sinomicrobium weinanense]